MGIRLRMRQAQFDRRLASDGTEVTYRRNVAGQSVEQVFRAIVTETGAIDATDHELEAYQRLATLDLAIGTVDADGDPVVLMVPSVVVINDDQWQTIQMAGRDHGDEAVCESWRLGRGNPIHMTARKDK